MASGKAVATWLLRASALALFVAALPLAGQGQTAPSRIAADRTAPGAQQPTVLSTSNGIPQVNIQTPSAAGVSRNTYRQFDVGGQGVILNNSRTNVQTQQAGWVQGNPWLSRGSARVILNEVHSSDPSQLRGYVEVAGPRAEVIVANPSGIAVDGGGFINASRVTLTTGTPRVEGDNLLGYRVQGGTVRIGGAGLDTRGADFTAILSRAVELNAGLWAQRLQVVVGAGEVDSAGLGGDASPQVQPLAAVGPDPAFALDVSELGGMYAGRITLRGTEAGLGVRNAGQMLASAGTLALTHDGWLSNSGRLQAQGGDVTVQVRGALTQTGVVVGDRDVQLQSEGEQSHSGTLAAAGHLQVQGSGHVQLGGQALAGNTLSVRAASLDVSHSDQAATHITLSATDGTLSAAGARIVAADRLQLQTPQALVTDGAQLQAGSLQLQAHDLSNRAGQLVQTGRSDQSIALAGTLDNTGGVIQSAADNFGMEARVVDNSAGLIVAASDLALQAGAVGNQAGKILADGSVALRAGALRGAGTLASAGNLRLSLQGDHSLGGSLQAGGDLLLETTGRLTNPVSVQAGGSLRVNAQDVDNQAGGELLSSQTTQLNVAGTLTNQGLVDGADTRIEAGTVDNLGTGRIYGDRVAIAADTLRNREDPQVGVQQAATLAGRERVDLGVQTLDNRAGALIFSGGDMAIGGGLDAGWRATGPAREVRNTAATIEAAADLRLASETIGNHNGGVATEMRLVSQGPVTQYQHAPGDVRSASDNGTRFMSDEVRIWDCESLCMDSSAGTSDAFTRYQFDRTVTASAVTASAPGKILSGGNMSLSASRLVNEDSHIVAGGTLEVQGTQADNRQTSGFRTTTEVGTATAYWRVRRSGRDSYGSQASTYAPSPVTETMALGLGRIEDHAAGASTGVAPAAAAATPPASGSAIPDANPVRTLPPSLQLPTASIYRVHPESGAPYLVETDPRFTQQRAWLSSSYMLSALQLDPAAWMARMGDGFYEQQLIRDQVMALTGQRRLGTYASDDQAYQALMDAGLTYARQWNLSPGIALTAEQMAQLTSDIVWLVTREVTLPDGSTRSVLVPQVYVRPQPGDLEGSGALLAGQTVQIHLSGDLASSGTLAGRSLLRIDADNIRNLGGHMQADTLALRAANDIDNVGGRLQAQSAAVLSAGRDLTFTTTTSSSAQQVGGNRFAQTGVDRVAGLYLSGPAAVLVATAGRNIALNAAEIVNAGEASTTVLQAGNDLNLGTVTTRSSQEIHWDASNRLQQSGSQERGTRIAAGGALSLGAGQDVNARAALVQAGDTLAVTAGRNIHITAGEATQQIDVASRHTSKDWASSRTLSLQESSQSTTAQGASFEGGSVAMSAGQDIHLRGSAVLADRDVTLQAGAHVTVEAAQDTYSQSHTRQETQRGIMSGGGASVFIGTRDQRVTQQGQGTQAAASTVGSLAGNVTVTAGQSYRQTGSDIVAPQGDITITAQTVTLDEARETASQSTEQVSRQSGVTVAITHPGITTAQGVEQQVNAARHTQSSRMRALAAANAAMQVREGAGQVRDAVARGDATGGMGISLSVGTSRSRSTEQSSADSARGSTATAGGDIRIRATGAGEASNLTLQGSQVTAAGVTTLQADNRVDLLAAHSTYEESNSQSNQSASVGVGVGVGRGGAGPSVTVSASGGKGRGAGSETRYLNTQVEGGRQVVIQSGGDTRLRGATITGAQVRAAVGGNLQIESLQDTSHYHESSQQASVAVTGSGSSVGGNVNVGRTRIDSDFRSVGQQSAIRAGDGGFDVQAQGQTSLIGGQITSTDRAVQDGANRYDSAGGTTTRDLHNSARYDAQSVSVGIGGGIQAPGASPSMGMSGAGVGSDSGEARSTTTAGISGVAGDAAARTGDASTSLQPVFNRDQVRADVAAQVAITSDFGRRASHAVGDYADARLREATQAGDAAGIAAWQEGGAARVGLHAVVGGLTGGVSGAAGAMASQAVIDTLGQAIADSNLPPGIKQALVLAAGTAVGVAAGGTAGGVAAFNATANNYLTHTDLRSKQQQLAACADDSCRRQVTAHWDRVSQARNARAGESIAAGSEPSTLQVMEVLAADMSNLAQYRAGLEDQLRSTTDPAQRANLQLQVNEADNSIRQIASQGKDALALLYQQTGDPRYQNAFQALMAATSGSEIGAALALPSGGGGNLNRGVLEGRPASNAAAQGAENVVAGAGTGKNGVTAAGARENTPSVVSANLAPPQNTYPVYPRGAGAAEGPLPPGYVTVSRWVSPEEASLWAQNQGTAIPSAVPRNGTPQLYVTEAGAPYPPGANGSVRIDFAVPAAMLSTGNSSTNFMILQPSSSTPIHNLVIHVPRGVTLPKARN